MTEIFSDFIAATVKVYLTDGLVLKGKLISLDGYLNCSLIDVITSFDEKYESLCVKGSNVETISYA